MSIKPLRRAASVVSGCFLAQITSQYALSQDLGAYVCRCPKRHGFRGHDRFATIDEDSPLTGNVARVKLAAPFAFSPDDHVC